MSSSHSDVVVVNDHEALKSVALDYLEGWFEGATDRMERALHPELAKRSRERSDGQHEIETLTSRFMIDATAQGRGKGRDVPDRAIDVRVEHIHGDIANVTVTSAIYVEYLHLVRTESGWKILNVLWAPASDTGGAN
jgi:putative lumazine-binding protein